MKVVVGGCSMSDYTGAEVERVYGEILAENIGADYIHHGAGCGSNYRTWRNITNLVMNNEITEDDLILVQYTDPTRQEFWSAYVNEHFTREQKYNGDIIRWKFNAHKWHNTNDFEHKFLKLKEEHFTSTEFDLERFEYNHYLFHNTIVSKNIKIAYIVMDYGIAKFIDRFNKNEEIHIPEDMSTEIYPMSKDIYLLDGDKSHLNQLGHIHLATIIEKFLKKKQWI
jgi:hypothetical protein